MTTRWRFWLGAAVVFVLLLWLLNDILLPFVVGMAVAYFLDPIVVRLQRMGLSRTWATTAVIAFHQVSRLVATSSAAGRSMSVTRRKWLVDTCSQGGPPSSSALGNVAQPAAAPARSSAAERPRGRGRCTGKVRTRPVTGLPPSGP